MAHSRNFNRYFRGKTVESVSAPCINVVTFHFTDGTSVALEEESFGNGVSGIVVCPACVVPRKKRSAACATRGR